jgi:hypothetical protein
LAYNATKHRREELAVVASIPAPPLVPAVVVVVFVITLLLLLYPDGFATNDALLETLLRLCACVVDVVVPLFPTNGDTNGLRTAAAAAPPPASIGDTNGR